MPDATGIYRAIPCGCGCGQVHGYRVVGLSSEPRKLVGRLAAERGADLLNAGKISSDDLNVLWGAADAEETFAAAMKRLDRERSGP